jgi:hypothetical protein
VVAQPVDDIRHRGSYRWVVVDGQDRLAPAFGDVVSRRGRHGVISDVLGGCRGLVPVAASRRWVRQVRSRLPCPGMLCRGLSGRSVPSPRRPRYRETEGRLGPRLEHERRGIQPDAPRPRCEASQARSAPAIQPRSTDAPRFPRGRRRDRTSRSRQQPRNSKRPPPAVPAESTTSAEQALCVSPTGTLQVVASTVASRPADSKAWRACEADGSLLSGRCLVRPR